MRSREGTQGKQRVGDMTAIEHDTVSDIRGLEFAARIRGREMTCWLDEGRLVGDRELVGRVRRLAGDRPIGPLELAQLVRDAVGSEVVIRFRAEPAAP